MALNKPVPRKEKKAITRFRPMIRSRHDSHDRLRELLPLMAFRSVIRLGSTTVVDDVQGLGGKRLEINTIQAVKNSANKRLMKQCFDKAGVKTAKWWSTFAELQQEKELEYPIVMKHIYGSRGTGNYLIKSKEELDKATNNRNLDSYIFEKFYSYNREYRLHVTQDGCFYTCRKMLKQDTPEDKKWYRNDSNSVWVVEENPQFDKPKNWDNIVADCVSALQAVGLDVGAFDVRIQSANDKKNREREAPEWIIIESNSAASHGDITSKRYVEVLPSLMINKAKATGLIA